MGDLWLVKFAPDPPPHHLKVLSTWDGDTTNTVNNITVTTDDSLTLYASGFDSTGMFWGYYADEWSADMLAGDFAPAQNDSPSHTFTITRPGMGYLTATYTDSGETLTARTGLVTVLPGAMRSLRINAAAHDGAAHPDTAISTAGRLFMWAGAYDAGGFWIRDTTVTWKATGTLDTTAFVDDADDRTSYRPAHPGSGYIIARCGTAADSFALTVTNSAPSATITAPGNTAGGGISISYTVSDAENDNVTLACEFSLDNGLDWYAATVQPTTPLTPLTYSGSLTWQSHVDLPGQVRDSVLFRATPSDPFTRGARAVSSPVTLRNLLGDLDHDLSVGFNDLVLFADDWRDDKTTADIGPALGTLPSLVPVRDGRLDHEDIYVFMQVWNWSFDDSLLNGPVARSAAAYTAVPLQVERSGSVNRIVYTGTHELSAFRLHASGSGIDTPEKSAALTDGNVEDVFLYRTAPDATWLTVHAALLEGAVQENSELMTFASDADVSITCELRYTDGSATAGTAPVRYALVQHSLHQPVIPEPNPSTGSVVFRNANGSVIIRDMQGSVMCRLQPEGDGAIRWEGTSREGKLLPAGLYYWQAESGDAGLILRAK